MELYIAETQTGIQEEAGNEMTLICNASNFNVAIDTIMFFGPNKLKQMCPNSLATENRFSAGTVTRTGQTCSLKILRPSLIYSGVYYCQVWPINKTCLNYTSNQVEVLLISTSNNHGTRAALISVSCILCAVMVVLLAVLLAVLSRRLRKDTDDQGIHMYVVYCYPLTIYTEYYYNFVSTEYKPIVFPRHCQVYT